MQLVDLANKYPNVEDMLKGLGWVENTSKDGMYKGSTTIKYDEFLRREGRGGAYTREEFLRKMIDKGWMTQGTIDSLKVGDLKSVKMENPDDKLTFTFDLTTYVKDFTLQLDQARQAYNQFRDVLHDKGFIADDDGYVDPVALMKSLSTTHYDDLSCEVTITPELYQKFFEEPQNKLVSWSNSGHKIEWIDDKGEEGTLSDFLTRKHLSIDYQALEEEIDEWDSSDDLQHMNHAPQTVGEIYTEMAQEVDRYMMCHDEKNPDYILIDSFRYDQLHSHRLEYCQKTRVYERGPMKFMGIPIVRFECGDTDFLMMTKAWKPVD